MGDDTQDCFSWYPVQVRPNCFKIAERNLVRQRFGVFAPTIEQRVQKNGRFRVRVGPLFPGYLFVGFDPEQGRWRKVDSTYGVSRLVASHEGRAASIPASFIAALKDRCNPAGLLQESRTLKSGDTVQVVNGPFANLVATVECLAEEQRVWVLLDLLGRRTRIKVPVEDLENTHYL